MTMQCLCGRRIGDQETLRAEIAAWSENVNTPSAGILAHEGSTTLVASARASAQRSRVDKVLVRPARHRRHDGPRCNPYAKGLTAARPTGQCTGLQGFLETESRTLWALGRHTRIPRPGPVSLCSSLTDFEHRPQPLRSPDQ